MKSASGPGDETRMIPDSQLVFVYGTLRRGGSNHFRLAAAEFVSEATVKSHVMHIFEKLGVRDRTAAVTAAMARGILAPPGAPPAGYPARG